MISGCKSVDSEDLDQNNKAIPSLGEISLGDSHVTVVEVLGSGFTETTETDYTGTYGEDLTVLNYESGIVVNIGKTSGKVVKVISTSPAFQTDLEIKVGDDAKTAFETYEPLFEQAVSRHRDEALTGWFIIENVIVIFDFDKSDNELTNKEISPDPRVEQIVLAYWEHFD